MKHTWAVVPIKGFERAKTRLGSRLGAQERATLAQALAKHVLRVLQQSPQLAGLLVCTDSQPVAELAASFGARVRFDAGPEHLHQIIDQALLQLRAGGAAAALVVMADLPRLSAAAVSKLLCALGHQPWVLSPDRGGRNTNALGLELRALLPTHFGTGDSFQRHLKAARAAGYSIQILHDPELAWDLDRPEDLAACDLPQVLLEPSASACSCSRRGRCAPRGHERETPSWHKAP